MNFMLSALPRSHRVLIAFFVCALLLGYGVSWLKMLEINALNIGQVVRDYRGDSADEFSEPKPYGEILQNTHAHVLSVPVVYFLLALLFLGTRMSERQKILCVIFLFSGFFMQYASLWLMRYAGAGFVYLGALGHALSDPVYLYMALRVLRETRCRAV